MVGLGKMGANMTTRLLAGGHHVVVYDRSTDAVNAAAAGGATGARNLGDLVAQLGGGRRVVWVMVPAGAPTDETIDALRDAMSPGDVIIDGGNSNYQDGLRAYERCKTKGVHLVDAGTSGGVWGLTEGYCLMVGGDDDAVTFCEPIFRTLAPQGGYAHVGRAG